ncbi:hypothetical protein MC7420_124 [Coleofasciculus chthonoplastes PCC 7420]|uniref:Uncharacterized protein n=1 Tax=Coleofasciculus chthonoplastes PCC 7420 TaxID=118168 RepID=B4W4Q5_9CYAN|nr:hypothetical protein [Coleofasciculus chthonoplastes]EDX70835.1 hypothetical protein MC7420_124 [Coleofasciculus chthonoplastes PCC 7420]
MRYATLRERFANALPTMAAWHTLISGLELVRSEGTLALSR